MAKQAAIVWACVAKRRHSLHEEMYGVWLECFRSRGRGCV